MSVTTVGAFDSVGAILVVTMLIVPGATAYLLTDRLHVMLALSVAVGAASSALGYLLAVRYDASIAGACGVRSAVTGVAAPGSPPVPTRLPKGLPPRPPTRPGRLTPSLPARCAGRP